MQSSIQMIIPFPSIDVIHLLVGYEADFQHGTEIPILEYVAHTFGECFATPMTDFGIGSEDRCNCIPTCQNNN